MKRLTDISNNVTRMLTARGIAFKAFELPAEKLSALEAAALLGVEAHLVYKTIVVLREKPGKPLLVVVPGPHEVDLKAVARAIGEKKVHLATQREAEQLTGLQTGGISPLALIQHGFQVLVDSTAQSLPEIYISGGQRGLNVCLLAQDLASLTNARFASISA